ncbi:MAG: AMP-binding protein [Alphaproteobacteria bacterium]|jgi:feruloyl-CoA synthase|nr:AMP-binding protein [Alphaproteobacteria bacterium]
MSEIRLAPDPAALGLRDPRYAPRRLRVERRDGNEILLTHPGAVEAGLATPLDAVARWSARTPKAPWLAERSGAGWRILTYAEGAGRIAALAGGLAGLGLTRETPLLVLARNGIDHALIAYAAMSQAIPVAAISPQYGLAGAILSRLAHAVDLIRPGAVLVDDAPAFATALDSEILAGLPVIALGHPGPGHVTLEALLRAPPTPVRARPEDIAKLLLTSGSTGQPKAVICRQVAVAITAAQVAACYDDPEPPVVVNQAPWSHSLGANAILQMVTHRGGTLYIDAGQPVAGRHLETVRNLEEIAPTYHNMVPAGWDLLAGELERNPTLARRFFSRVRVLQYGGAALSQSTCDRIQAVARATCGEGISFASGYGATETGPTATNVHWPNLTMGLMGLPVPGTTVKLTPAQGRLEFRVKGPQLCAGYYRNPEATAAAFDEEGFYRLGDAATPVDPGRPELGLRFDGRLSENFKLANGTFVNVGALRVDALSSIGGAAADAVVCGEGESGVGLLIFLNAPFCRDLVEASAPSRGSPENLAEAPAVRQAIASGLERLNRAGRGGAGRVQRALILSDPPHAPSGEITDKGYINQALARSRRAAEVARLFADPDDPAVLRLDNATA